MRRMNVLAMVVPVDEAPTTATVFGAKSGANSSPVVPTFLRSVRPRCVVCICTVSENDGGVYGHGTCRIHDHRIEVQLGDVIGECHEQTVGTAEPNHDVDDRIDGERRPPARALGGSARSARC